MGIRLLTRPEKTPNLLAGMSTNQATIHSAISLWTFKHYPNEQDEWPIEAKLDRILEAGFQNVVGPAHQVPGLVAAIRQRGLGFAGQFQLYHVKDAESLITAQLEVGDGPINCQLGFHHTTLSEAIEMIETINEVANSLGTELHYEVHRNTAFETPEKTTALIDAFNRLGKSPLRLNFDYSHPALVKHLTPDQYVSRLLDRPECLRMSRLIHLRPFNGQHCQIPVTDGRGEIAPEFAEYLHFARTVLATWKRDRTCDDTLWVVPELGPVALPGYGLSCFPDVVEDALILMRELERIWAEIVE